MERRANSYLRGHILCGLCPVCGRAALRIYQYAKTPAPLKVPSTPAPITRTGAAFRVLREVVIFESLYKSNKWIWLFGIAFHGALVLVLFRHLRYFIQPVWLPVQLAQPFGIYAGFAMVGGAAGALGAARLDRQGALYQRRRSIISFCSCSF